jgi:hypothetical protein
MMACYAFYSVHLTSQIITSFARSNSPIPLTTELESAYFAECIAHLSVPLLGQ